MINRKPIRRGSKTPERLCAVYHFASTGGFNSPCVFSAKSPAAWQCKFANFFEQRQFFHFFRAGGIVVVIGYRFKDRNRQIPQGLKFYIAETKFSTFPFSSFKTIVDAVIQHRRANAYL